MSNKRDFKKSVDAVGGAVVSELWLAYYNVEDADRSLINSAIGNLVAAITVARAKANRLFGKGVREFPDYKAYAVARKEFTKKNYEETLAVFNKALASALKDFNKALPESERQANKAFAQEQ